jgi:ribosomal protein S18 acetylase RimI-like enzyme
MNNSIHYRKAAIADIPTLIKLRIEFLKEVDNSDVIPYGFETELEVFFLKHLPGGDFIFLLAENETEIVSMGCVYFQVFPPSFVNPSGKKAYIHNIYTLPSFRRQGLSKAIFTKLMQEVSDRGITHVSLHASDDGRALCEQFGFVKKDNEMSWKASI